MTHPIRTLLIANRGEIAVRVARTAKAMGMRVVAVYSDADAGAPHVRAADTAVRLGPPPAAESYLRSDLILDAAKKTGADAIHPGYGFLSENADFSEACAAAGIVFVGPKAETIRAMGSKSAAKDLMEQAGVPTLTGYQGEDQSVDRFLTEAGRIGYPVLLKATAGGGGKGMRLVERPDDLADALASAQREAKSAFGDDRFLVEKYLGRPRHLEVQVFGDTHGNVVHLHERDCSVQRRHQKVIEEAPAPNLPDDVRRKLHAAGVEAARAVDYVGAGTVEFLYDGEAGVYFMEMNTRLQVEHPVTECVTGLDLVEWQLRVAEGEPLPLKQDDVGCQGWAFESRLYAEEPNREFAPSIGTLTTLALPREREGVRVDSGVVEGREITPYYDPMIAKIITSGPTRAIALGRMRAALSETRVTGLETNARFLDRLCAADGFAACDVSTRFIEENRDALFAEAKRPLAALAAALLALREEGDRREPWEALSGFRLNGPSEELYWLTLDDAPALAVLAETAEGFEARLEHGTSAAERRKGDVEMTSETFVFSGALENGRARIVTDGVETLVDVAAHAGGLRVHIDAEHWDVGLADPLSGAADGHSAAGSLVAAMPGVVTGLAVEPGASVAAGATLMVMEAMKMEHAVKAPADGVVKAFRFSPGDQVKDGDLLVEFEGA
ncbi:MAG: acetyl/propionyl/methylcrotonyl-CoA carboxylase subunit alpha [Pseudomonadota bacterium]